MERRHRGGARTFVGGPQGPDRQALIEALRFVDNNNLELAMENAYLVEQIIHLLETHAKSLDEFSMKMTHLKKKLKAYKEQTKEMEDNREGVLALLKMCDALILEIIEIQDFQVQELKNTEVAPQDEPEGARSEDKTQTDVALQQIKNDITLKMDQLKKKIVEKNKIISNLTDETLAQARQLSFSSFKLRLKQTELDQSIKKCNILQQEFKTKLAEREKSWETKLNEMKRQWLEKEDTLKKSVIKAESELQQVIIQNIKLQEFVFEKKKQGFWGKKRNENRNTEEDTAEYPTQVGHEEEEEEDKKEEKAKKWLFWRKKNQMVKEAAAGSDQPDQEERQEDEKPKKRGFWRRGGKKKETGAQGSRKEGDGAACPETEEQ